MVPPPGGGDGECAWLAPPCARADLGLVGVWHRVRAVDPGPGCVDGIVDGRLEGGAEGLGCSGAWQDVGVGTVGA